jgi:hypothetical protein
VPEKLSFLGEPMLDLLLSWAPPPCGLLFMETFYHIFSPSTTQMICFVLVDYVPIFNLGQNIRARACVLARARVRVYVCERER